MCELLTALLPCRERDYPEGAEFETPPSGVPRPTYCAERAGSHPDLSSHLCGGELLPQRFNLVRFVGQS